MMKEKRPQEEKHNRSEKEIRQVHMDVIELNQVGQFRKSTLEEV